MSWEAKKFYTKNKLVQFLNDLPYLEAERAKVMWIAITGEEEEDDELEDASHWLVIYHVPRYLG